VVEVNVVLDGVVGAQLLLLAFLFRLEDDQANHIIVAEDGEGGDRRAAERGKEEKMIKMK
jgi:hypothetical protein